MKHRILIDVQKTATAWADWEEPRSLNDDSRCLGRDSNREPLEHVLVLPLH